MKKAIFIILILSFIYIMTSNDKIKTDFKSLANDVFNDLKGKMKLLLPEQITRAYNAATSLKQVGLTNKQISFVLPQLALETGHFKSQALADDNNLSGIKYFGQAGASKGKTPAPKGEGNATNADGDTSRDYYARYNSYIDWAKDYKRIMDTVGKVRPLDATDIIDFAARLKKNSYFQAPLNEYTRGLQLTANYYKPILSII